MEDGTVVTRRATRRATRGRGGRSALLLGGPVVALIVTAVLHAPLDVLSVVRWTVGPPAAPADGAAPSARVDDVRRPPATDDGSSAAAAPSEDGSDERPSPLAGAPTGRWGSPGERPPVPGLRVEELRGGWRVEAGAEEAAALGVIAGHAWAHADAATGRAPGATGAVPGADAGAVVTLEAVERPGTGHAVVTVLVATTERVQRLAVPVTFGATGPVIAGPPWVLPSPSTDAEVLTGTPIGDEVLIAAAREALDLAGFDASRLVALEVTDGWPFIARLADDREGHPWLRWHLDRFVVTGLPLDRAAGMHESTGMSTGGRGSHE